MIRFGIVGLGKMGRNHAKTLMNHAGCTLAGIYDIDREKVEDFCSLFEGVTNYRSLADMMDLDAVIIATPATTHYEILKAFRDRRIHVLCEKPVTATFAEYEELKGMFTGMDMVIEVGYCEKYNESVSHFRQHNISGIFSDHSEIRFTRESIATSNTDVNVIRDTMTHDLDLLFYMFPYLALPQAIDVRDLVYKDRNEINRVEIELVFAEDRRKYIIVCEKPAENTIRSCEILDLKKNNKLFIDFITREFDGILLDRSEKDNLTKQLDHFIACIRRHQKGEIQSDLAQIHKVCVTTEMVVNAVMTEIDIRERVQRSPVLN